VIALIYGFLLKAEVLKMSPGSDAMQKVGAAIRSGAYAYLSKQVKTMLPLVVVLAILLYFLFSGQSGYTFVSSIGVSIAFLIGVLSSYTAGYIGMGMAVSGNQRTAHQAMTSYKKALDAAFKSGAVGGMMTVGLALLGATIIFAIFEMVFKIDATKVLIGFGFGGSLAALFMRVGGGIFTKAADVGADLVGKVEQDIPEDDPRNAATIADNVGDNVGDCAGMAADVFESYLVTLVAAMILGYKVSNDPTVALALVLFPLIVHAIGIFASIIGIATVKGTDDLTQSPMKPMGMGLVVTAIIALIIIGVVVFSFMPSIKDGITVINADGSTSTFGPIYFLIAPAIGVLLAIVIAMLTQEYTATDRPPVTELAHASRTGPATLILSGISLGLESSAWGAMAIVAALSAIVFLFNQNAIMSAYGIALAGLGLLTTTGFILAMDTFGPISDNANGILEMSGDANNEKGEYGLKVVAELDAAGNTTKALTKGFAIATAVIAAVALFRTFMTDAGLNEAGFSLANPIVLIGLLVGGAAPFLFCSFAINAVSRAAFQLVQEVRRQFHADPGIMAGTSTPDYAKCVDLSTSAAQRELLAPGILAICLPILVGFSLGPSALGGYLAGVIVSGQLMAVMLSNSGGAMDNAKKKIEDGLYGGKGTDEHKAAVIGDTVGDPFKDTAGPALNPLIKVMNLVAVLIAGVVISPTVEMKIGVSIVTALLLAGAIILSKRSSATETDLPNQSK
jgi:K(+)-stimulated pyrophosphate-energized sodium pump